MTQQAAVGHISERNVKDDFGRAICYQNKDFWKYVETKRHKGQIMTKQDVFKLTHQERESFFMKWKHGMTDMNVNWEFEYSLLQFLRNFRDVSIDAIDPYFRQAVIDRRIFEEYCDKIKGEIGLWTGKKPTVAPEVQELIDAVGGTVVGQVDTRN